MLRTLALATALSSSVLCTAASNGPVGYQWPQPQPQSSSQPQKSGSGQGYGAPSVYPSQSSSATGISTQATSLAPTATIDIGVIVGTQTSLPAATAPVNKFLGVPFAQSPPERFSPPQPAAKLNGTLQAQAWKPACIQQFVYPILVQQFTKGIFNEPPPEESEDCLYLNIYAPSSPPPPGGRAVMYWMFGGSFQFGTGSLPAYDGSAFASYQDVVVVVLNYRTNAFGFPNSPELPITGQNLGFLDQQAGLEFVQRNIASFGGDPKKVTIFGESAGSLSVDALLTSYTTENAPFRAAILESGQYTYGRAPGSNNSTASWSALVKALNRTTSQSNLACVRSANATTIKNIIETNALGFSPVADNHTLLANPAAARAANKFAQVPVLSGSNWGEGRLFEFGQNNYSQALQNFFGKTVPEIIPQIQQALPEGNITGYNTAYDRISQVYTLWHFQCTQGLMTNQTAAQGVPAWRYVYNASFPNQEAFANAGAYHSAEIVQVYGTYPGGPVNNLTKSPLGLQPSNVPPTAQQVALSSYMNGAWAKFAKNPQGGPGWNALGTFGGLSIGALGANGSSGVTVVSYSEVDQYCYLFYPAYRKVGDNVPVSF